jgi:hypothetical protein
MLFEMHYRGMVEDLLMQFRDASSTETGFSGFSSGVPYLI